MAFVVKILSYDNLSEDVKQNNLLSNNGSGMEYASYLVVEHNGQTVRVESSAMEPEDVSFYRDLKWVAEAIEEAYNWGVGDSKKE